MTPTFETILNQAKGLPASEREKLIESLKQISEKNESGKRLGKIRAFRGKYSRILPSTEEFLAAKRKEVEIEEN